MKKYIKYMIIFLVIIIIILAMILMFLSKKGSFKKTNIEESNNQINMGLFRNIENENNYFIAKNIIDRYIEDIKNLNGDNYINNDTLKVSRNEAIKTRKEEALKSLNSLIDEQYKENKKIDEDFYTNESKKYMIQGDYTRPDVIYNVILNEMYEYQYTENITLFLVFSKIKDNKFNLLIKYDSSTNACSVFLSDYIEENNYNINKKDINISKTNIEANMYNKVILGNVTDEQMAKEYFNIQKNNLLYDFKEEYNKLDAEYRKKRFPDYSTFEEYVSEIKEKLKNSKLSQYGIDTINNKKTYLLMDDSNNYYLIICNNGLVDYTVQLDTYTIDSEKFLQQYNNADITKKVQFNIDKFIKMINTKDYKNSYALLYDEFKNKYFQTEDSYKQYIKANFFEYNNVTYDKFSNEGDTYIFELTLSDKTQKDSKTKKLTIIMKLKEGTDFVMSFNLE